jgi:hypothetical protein
VRPRGNQRAPGARDAPGALAGEERDSWLLVFCSRLTLVVLLPALVGCMHMTGQVRVTESFDTLPIGPPTQEVVVVPGATRVDFGYEFDGEALVVTAQELEYCDDQVVQKYEKRKTSTRELRSLHWALLLGGLAAGSVGTGLLVFGRPGEHVVGAAGSSTDESYFLAGTGLVALGGGLLASEIVDGFLARDKSSVERVFDRVESSTRRVCRRQPAVGAEVVLSQSGTPIAVLRADGAGEIRIGTATPPLESVPFNVPFLEVDCRGCSSANAGGVAVVLPPLVGAAIAMRHRDGVEIERWLAKYPDHPEAPRMRRVLDDLGGRRLERFGESTVRVYSAGLPSCTGPDDVGCMSLGHGSGLAFTSPLGDETGYFVLTNQHVVRARAVVAVQFSPVEEVFPAVVVDESVDEDVALLLVLVKDEEVLGRLPLWDLKDLPVMELVGQEEYMAHPGRSPLKQGERLVVKGYPRDPTQRSPRDTRGTFSGWSLQNIRMDTPARGRLTPVLETDAAAAAGASGGPVCTESGKFVGLIYGGPVSGAGGTLVIPSGLVMTLARRGAMRLATFSGIAEVYDSIASYAALARCVAHFLLFEQYFSRHLAEVEATESAESALAALDEAVMADPGSAAAWVFASWISWQVFILQALDCKRLMESQATDAAAIERCAKRMCEGLDNAFLAANEATKLAPEYLKESHPVYSYLLRVAEAKRDIRCP